MDLLPCTVPTVPSSSFIPFIVLSQKATFNNFRNFRSICRNANFEEAMSLSTIDLRPLSDSSDEVADIESESLIPHHRHQNVKPLLFPTRARSFNAISLALNLILTVLLLSTALVAYLGRSAYECQCNQSDHARHYCKSLIRSLECVDLVDHIIRLTRRSRSSRLGGYQPRLTPHAIQLHRLVTIQPELGGTDGARGGKLDRPPPP